MKHWIKMLLCCLPAVFAEGKAGAQTADDSLYSAIPIELDSFVVSASRKGFDVQAFIRRVQHDTTFYKAFRSLHLVPYTAANDVRMRGRRGDVIASLHSRTQQAVARGCRSMKVLEEQVTGDFYDRKKDYNYYTAQLYAYLFFTKGSVCGENDVVAGALSLKGKGGLEKSKWQLKQLIFNPGARVKGIPFMGDRAALFEPDEARKYNFSLGSEVHDGVDCLRFAAVPKEEYKSDVVYNSLVTWFRKGDYAIVARDYSLSYHTPFYDFDVVMSVQLTTAHGRLLPSSISYRGNWHVATKDRERGEFTATFRY